MVSIGSEVESKENPVMTRFLALGGAAAFFLLPCAAAQTHWVVDASNGPGTNFTSVGGAVGAASDDDVILVRAGDYVETVRSTKALTFLIESSVTIYELMSMSLPAGKTFQVSGGTFNVLRFYDCEGTGHVQNVSVNYPGSFDVLECAGVTVRDSSFGRSATVSESTVAFSGCSFLGYDFTVGLRSFNSSVSLANSTAIGADELCGTGSVASPAISMTNGRLTLTHTAVAAGTTGSCGGPTVAIQGFGTANVFVDESSRISGTGGAPGVAGTSVLSRPTPSTRATLAGLGGQLDVVAEATPGAAVALMASMPAAPLITPWGPLWIEPSLTLLLVAGTTNVDGELAVSLQLSPGLPLGASVMFQAVAVSPLVLGTPSHLVLQ